MHKIVRKLTHLFLATLLTVQSLVYPWISILPAPPPAHAQESPPKEASYSAQTPAPSPLDPLLDLDTLFPSTQSAEIHTPEAIPEATESAKPEAIPEPSPLQTSEPVNSPTPTSTPQPTTTPTISPSASPSPQPETPVNVLTKPTTLESIISPFTISLAYPFAGSYPLTYGFGERSNSSFISRMQSLFHVEAHDGLDFAMDTGTPILAADSGHVIFAGSGSYGETIIISHSWGKSYYGHLSTIEVNVGQKVTRGDLLGYSGETGITTGPHLHFAIAPKSPNLQNGYHGLIDPSPYLNDQNRSTVNVLGTKTKHQGKLSLLKSNLGTGDQLKARYAGNSQGLTAQIKSKGHDISALTPTLVNDGSSTEIIFDMPRALTPGQYSLEVTDSDTTSESIDFTWGVLAINANQSVYAPGQSVSLALAVLDNRGEMVCDAELALSITTPSGDLHTLTTDEKQIVLNSDVCAQKNYTLTPDFETSFSVEEEGQYLLHLESTTTDGVRSIDSKVSVSTQDSLIITRTSATRLYPIHRYPMVLTITTPNNFKGVIEEKVPSNFTITDPDVDYLNSLGMSVEQATFTAEQQDGYQSIKWEVDWTAGSTHSLAYTYDAPDASPAFYTLGEASLNPSDPSLTPTTEGRVWQLAIDTTTGNGMLIYDTDAANAETPHSRTWTPSDLSSEANMRADGTKFEDVNHTLVEPATTRDEYIRASLDASGTLNVQVYNGSTWSNGTSAPANGNFTVSIGTTDDVNRSFDIAYETTSGDALVVYEDSTTDDKTLKYRTWDGSDWSGESTLDYSAVAEGGSNDQAQWIELEKRTTSGANEIMLGWKDTTGDGIYGTIWDGSSWQDIALINASGVNTARKSFDVAWEGTSDQGLIMYGTGTTTDHSVYDISGSSWTDGASSVNPGEAVDWLSAAGDVDSDYIAVIITSGASTTSSDAAVDMWNGTNWTTVTTPTDDSDIDTYGFSQGADVAWEQVSADRALFVWRDDATADTLTTLNYMVYDISANQFQEIDDNTVCLLTEGAAGTTEQVTALGNAEDSGGPCTGAGLWAGTVSGIVAVPDPSSADIMVLAQNETTLDIRPETQLWNGDANGTWLTQTSNMGAFETDSSPGTLATSAIPIRAWDFSWRTSSADNTGLLVYDEDGANADQPPHYRTWDGSDFSSEANLLDYITATSSEVKFSVVVPAPTRDEYMSGRLTSDGHLTVQLWDGDSWEYGSGAPDGGVFQKTMLSTGTNYRTFDIAYEKTSGDALVVYDDSTDADSKLKYRTWNGSTWSAESELDYTSIDESVDFAGWIELEGRNSGNEIMLGWVDQTNDTVYGSVWDGSTWQNSSSINTTGLTSTRQYFDVAWEGTSDQGMIVYGTGTTTDYSVYDISGASWTDGSSSGNPGEAVDWLRLDGDPNTDYIAMMIISGASTTTSDALADMWNGTDWTTITTPTEDTDINTYGFSQGADVAWQRGTTADRALFVWRDGTTAETSLRYMIFDISVGQFLEVDDNSVCTLTEGAAGTTEQVTSLANAEDSGGPCSGLGTEAGTISGIQLFADPGSSIIAVLGENETVLDVKPEMELWNGDTNGTWLTQTSNMGAFEIDASLGTLPTATVPTLPYSFAFSRVPLTITVSGNVYSVSGGTETVCAGSSELRLRTSSTTYTASCTDSTGAFSFTGIAPPSSGAGMVIWIEALSTDGSTAIRYDGTGNSTSNALYESTASVTSDDTTASTILTLDTYDNGDDSDIPYTATDAGTDTLVVSSNFNLRINLKSGVANGSTVFDPNGTVTTQGTGSLHADDNAVTYLDTATNSIASDVLIDDGAKVNFDADTTITGGDITVLSGGDVSSSTGTVTLGATGSIGGGSTGSVFQLTNLVVSTGTTTLGSDADNSLSFTGDINISSGATLALNSKTADVDGGNVTTTSTGSITCSGCNAGGITLSGDGSTNGIGGGSGSITLYNLTLDGASNTTAVGTASITISNTLTIGVNRTLTAPSGTLSLGGNFANSGTYTHNSGTISLIGSADTTQAISGATTFNHFSATGGNRIITFASSTTYTITTSANLTLTGTDCDNLLMIRSATPGTTFTLTDSSGGSTSVSYADLQDVNATNAITASTSVDSGNNTNLTIAANSCKGASTNAAASGYSFQRKTFYDSVNARYWAFFHDGDQIEARYSSDGTTWSVEDDHLAYDTNDFSVWQASISGTSYVWLAVTNSNTIGVKRGTLSSSSITWETEEALAIDGGPTDDNSFPYISLDSSNYIWVIARNYAGSNYKIQAVRSDDTTGLANATWSGVSFGSTVSINAISDPQANSNTYGNIVPLASQDMYATFVSGTDIMGCKWVNSSTQWQAASGLTCESGVGSNGGPSIINDSGNNGALPGTGRQVVRDSNDNLFSFVNHAGSCELWSSSDGSSWTEENPASNPSCVSGGEVAVDIASDDTIHLLYESSATVTTWNTFSGGIGGSFGGSPQTVHSSSNSTTNINLKLDSNNIPHVVLYDVSIGGFGNIIYDNRIGGSWNGSDVTIDSITEFLNGTLSLTISEDNAPEIAYENTDTLATAAASGDDNDPDTAGQWNLYDLDGSSSFAGVSIGIDSDGNTWISYLDENGASDYLSLAKRTDGSEDSAWSTGWTTDIHDSNQGSEPSLTILGGDIYLFYADEGAALKYDLYNGTWGGETSLQTSTKQDIKSISSASSNQIDYLYSDNTDVFWASLGLSTPATQDSIDTTTGATTDNISAVADNSGNVHLVFVDDESTDQISYKKWNGSSWSSATLVSDAASNNDGYVSLSYDTNNAALYAFWIDTSASDIYYSSCTVASSCDSASEWAAQTSWVATGTNAQLSTGYKNSTDKIFGTWTQDSASPYHLGWSGITISGASNNAPNSPTSLAQKTTGDVVITTGEWVSATSVKFTASADDPDASDTLYLCIEKDILGVSFSNTEDSCGSGVAYSGSPVSVTHTISSQTDASEYHWQARVKDTAGAYSSWVSYDVNAESARDYGLDTTAPTSGTIYDGTTVGVDTTFSTTSLSVLSANWDSFNSDVSGLSRYDYSIGTTAGATDIKTWTSNSTTTSVTATGLTLQSAQLYYFNVRAVDNAGNIQSGVSSNGQVISPSISFAISPSTTTFTNLNSGNSYTNSQDTVLTTSTNAYNGYVIRAFVTDYLRNGATTIGDFSGGTYASPATWAGSETGFGYTSSDTTIQGANKFATGTLYAPFSQTGPGDIVADHTSNVSGTAISDESFTLTYKVKTLSTQPAKSYSTTVVYTATAQY